MLLCNSSGVYVKINRDLGCHEKSHLYSSNMHNYKTDFLAAAGQSHAT